jgi:hypothetical protein
METPYKRVIRSLKPKGDCLVSTLRGDRDGYVRLGFAPKRKPTERLAHRIVWIEHNGPIPKGMLILHRCDNPPCCNIEHLFIGTPGDNMRDCRRKGHRHFGASHYNTQLTERDVVAIRKAREGGATYRALGERYGITTQAAFHIVKRKNWAHVA